MDRDQDLGSGRRPSPLAKQLRKNAVQKKRQDVQRQVRNQQLVMTHTPPRDDAV